MEESEDTLLVVDGKDAAYRLGRDGKPVRLKGSDGLADAMKARQNLQGLADLSGGNAPPIPPMPPEGALLARGWVPTLRADDEWFKVVDDQVVVTRTRSNWLRPVGPKFPRDGVCKADGSVGRPLLLCVGPSLRVLRVDLDSGERSPELDVQPKVFTQHFGPVTGYHPRTLAVDTDCRGEAGGSFCVRDSDGSYATHALPAVPEKSGIRYVFPGELMPASRSADGSIWFWRASEGKRYVFAPAQLKEVSVALGWDTETPAAKKAPKFTEVAALLTPSGLRTFYIPSLFEPLPEHPAGYAIDWALDGSGKVRLTDVRGVVAPIGAHALRVDKGKLYETNDGWSTWYEVEAPPTGVPDNFAGATCDYRGCLLGPWARIGWERPAATP